MVSERTDPFEHGPATRSDIPARRQQSPTACSSFQMFVKIPLPWAVAVLAQVHRGPRAIVDLVDLSTDSLFRRKS